MTPSQNSTFVTNVYNRTKCLIRQGHTVHLIGHSYGGAIVACVARRFKEEAQDEETHSLKQRLIITTFGSVYVPHTRLTEGMNILHFMNINDIARRCNHLSFVVNNMSIVVSEDSNNHSNVVWLIPDNYYSTPSSIPSLMGSNVEWESHNGYNFSDLLLKRHLFFSRTGQ